MNAVDLTCCQFLTGLAFLALAATAALAWRKAENRQIWQWLALLGLAQGVVTWADLLAGLIGHSWIATGLQLVCRAAACVALVEYGQRVFAPCHAWLMRRWTYGLLGLVAFLIVGFGHLAWLDHEYCAVLIWQGGLMGVLLGMRAFAEPEHQLPEHQSTVPLNIAAGALLVSLVAACMQWIPLVALAALIALASAWLSHRQARTHGARLHWLKESLVPASFLLIAASGWLMLSQSVENPAEFALIGTLGGEEQAGAGSGTDDADNPDGPDRDQPAEGEALQVVEAIAASPEIRRFGMAVIPIVAFVLIILGLSRLPAAR
jgi:hypothetical protein